MADYPFMLLERGGQTEISELFEQWHVQPNIQFTTWDDYAILAMVESNPGISMLPRLILQCIPYQVVIKELARPAYRRICLALREKKAASLAVSRFLAYSWLAERRHPLNGRT